MGFLPPRRGLPPGALIPLPPTPLPIGEGCDGGEPHSAKRAGLTLSDLFLAEAFDRVLVHAVEVEPRAKAQERAAEADGRPIEKHELAGHHKSAALGAQRPHDLAKFLAPVFARTDPVGRGAHAVVEDRPAKKPGPDVHGLARPAAEPGETPHLVSLGDPRLVAGLEPAVEFDHAEHEARREDAHAAVVEQVDAVDGPPAGPRDRIIAEMRIAVNDAVAEERAPPRIEQAD